VVSTQSTTRYYIQLFFFFFFFSHTKIFLLHVTHQTQSHRPGQIAGPSHLIQNSLMFPYRKHQIPKKSHYEHPEEEKGKGDHLKPIRVGPS
jgi:hypothetical protein